jgi:hypothetical protein
MESQKRSTPVNTDMKQSKKVIIILLILKYIKMIVTFPEPLSPETIILAERCWLTRI